MSAVEKLLSRISGFGVRGLRRPSEAAGIGYAAFDSFSGDEQNQDDYVNLKQSKLYGLLKSGDLGKVRKVGRPSEAARETLQLHHESCLQASDMAVASLNLPSPRMAYQNPMAYLETELRKARQELTSRRVNDLFDEARRDLLQWPDIRGTERPSIDIVVCIHNSLEVVRRCLTSVLADESSSYNLILVDDGSNGRTKRFLEHFTSEHPCCRLVSHPHAKGYTCAANTGLRESKAHYVVLLNSDTIVSKGWLRRLIRCAEAAPEIGVVGPLSNAASWQSVPRLFGPDGDFAINRLPKGLNVDGMAGLIADISPRDYPRVQFINGFCFMLKRRLIDCIGEFDEENFPRGFGEENDYCIRALDAGFELAVADDTYVFHEKSASYRHEQRRRLSAHGSEALRRKHGKRRVGDLISEMKRNCALDFHREKIQDAIHHVGARPSPVVAEPFRVLFLLPIRGGGGGTHSVIQEVEGMRELGVDARVAVKEANRCDFESHYGDRLCLEEICFFFNSQSELSEFASGFHVVVATVYHSVRLLEKIIDLHPEVMPAYYIQDYEALFFETGTSDRDEAEGSYSSIPNAVCFAKTRWLCEIVRENHNVRVDKVEPSIDEEIYYPNVTVKPSRAPVRIAAMVRPSTPRRSPALTMQTLKRLKEKYGGGVEVEIFGVQPDDPDFRALEVDFAFENRGVLRRQEVADLLRRSDIFVDFSTYQAFGRTGLEAMACGCATVLPLEGGCSEYAVHEENAISVDTTDSEQCFLATERLVTEHEFRKRMSRNALRTGSKYSRRQAALSEIQLFFSRWKQRQWGPPSIFTVKKLSRIRIGALLPGKFGRPLAGSSCIRLSLPFAHLTPRIEFVRLRSSTLTDDARFDVVIVQRTACADLDEAEAFLLAVRKRGARLIYELDDALWDVPSTHPEAEKYSRSKESGRLFAQQADLVTASSSGLAEYLRAYNDHVRLIPNALDASLWGLSPDFRYPAIPTDGPLRVLYMGTGTHSADFSAISPVLEALVADGHIQVEVVGALGNEEPPPWLRTLKVTPGFKDYAVFVSWLRSKGPWHIGIAPLRDNLFNRCKSWIKFLDYSALGLVTVAERTPYGEVIRNGSNGILAGTNDDGWKSVMDSALADRVVLEDLRRRAYEEVVSRHTLEQRAPLWEQAVYEVLGEAPGEMTEHVSRNSPIPGLEATRPSDSDSRFFNDTFVSGEKRPSHGK